MIGVGLTRMELARRAGVDPRGLRHFFNDGFNATAGWMDRLLKVIRRAEGGGVAEEVTRLAEIGERRRRSQMSR